MNNLIKEAEKTSKLEKEKTLARTILKEFKKRQEERRPFENQWQLNMNFLMGNQYCDITKFGEVEEFEKQFFWQEREVFNHIAPLVEVRLAKLSRVKPEMTVVPSGSEDKDLSTAKISKKILKYIQNSKKLSEVVTNACKWSEICGTSFYKVAWNGRGGRVFAKTLSGSEVKDGDVVIDCVTPFEIFPENSTCGSLGSCKSLIYARAVPVSEIEAVWGEKVEAEKLNVFSLDLASNINGVVGNGASKKITDSTREDSAMIIEFYERATKEFPYGRLVIVCGEKVLYEGELPYIGENGERDFPFVRQTALETAGCFWGTSIIERIIPIQRAYNAVKNRKHEFLNRISMGVLTVEDGSVDIESLEDEGLSPGKVLIYRQGSSAPSFMPCGNVPSDFTIEEDRLLNEFLLISGVSDLMRSTGAYANNLSGTALELLMEQDNTRLQFTVESLKEAIRVVAEKSLRLYKQFALMPKLAKIANDDGGVEMFYFSGSDIGADDVVFETEQEATQTLAQKKSMVFELLQSGLLSDESGKITSRMKSKVLEMLGFGIWENAQDVDSLHLRKAKKENICVINQEKIKVSEIDDHNLHINEHIAFMLSGDFENACKNDGKIEEKFLEHIRMHKKMQALTMQSESVKGENE